jgi:membrane protein YqaA with SNARE-associated domain
MSLLGLLLLSFAGGIVWLFNVETAAMVYGATSGFGPVAVGLTCALGQTLAYAFLFFAGDRLLRRWGWARRRVERMRARYDVRLRRGFLGLTAPAALVGMPPMTGMAALAGGFRVPLAPFVAIALTLRSVRFVVLAVAGAQIVSWWHGLW